MPQKDPPYKWHDKGQDIWKQLKYQCFVMSSNFGEHSIKEGLETSVCNITLLYANNVSLAYWLLKYRRKLSFFLSFIASLNGNVKSMEIFATSVRRRHKELFQTKGFQYLGTCNICNLYPGCKGRLFCCLIANAFFFPWSTCRPLLAIRQVLPQCNILSWPEKVINVLKKFLVLNLARFYLFESCSVANRLPKVKL